AVEITRANQKHVILAQPQLFLIRDSVSSRPLLHQNDQRRCDMSRLLVIEDERKVARSLQRGLQSEGYDVVTVANGDDGFKQANTQSFDCLILDLMLPGRDGLQVLADLRKAGKAVPVIILTAR